VTIKADDLPLRSVLARILRDAELSYLVRDEVILITSAETARNWLYTVVYPLNEKTVARIRETMPPEQIEQKIQAWMGPKSWQGAGGQGTITTLALGKLRALVVTQSYRGHQQIADLLGRPGIRAEGLLPQDRGVTPLRVPVAEPAVRVPRTKAARAGKKPSAKAVDPFGGEDEPLAPAAKSPAKPAADDPFGDPTPVKRKANWPPADQNPFAPAPFKPQEQPAKRPPPPDQDPFG
jgi:hypothetical protein